MITDDSVKNLQHQPDGQRLSTGEFVIETVSTDSKVPVRLWTMVYSVLTVCLLSLLAGVTLAFPSPVLVELLQLDDPQFRFDTQLADIFGVSVLKRYRVTVKGNDHHCIHTQTKELISLVDSWIGMGKSSLGRVRNST